MLWFASCWDEASVDFMERFEPPCYKVASASLTDHDLLAQAAAHRPAARSSPPACRPSTRSTRPWPWRAASDLLIAHATSTYPCPVGELNLRMIGDAASGCFPECPIGYSGHETGLAPTWAAVTLGATFVERHITLDRAMWGSDQAASVEIGGFMRLVSQHPRHRARAGRRRQARLRRRAAAARQAPPREDARARRPPDTRSAGRSSSPPS